MVHQQNGQGKARATEGRWLTLLFCFVLLLPTNFLGKAFADSFEDRRIRTGARILRSLIAADLDLAEKRNPKGELVIWLVGGDAKLHVELRDLIAPQSKPSNGLIREYPVRFESVSTQASMASKELPVAVFVTQPLSQSQLTAWIEQGRTAKRILFSPFEGDVERGVTAGLSVQAKVQPMLNQGSMQSIGLRLKPFFARVAKVVP
jgi:hypothetical protein